MIARHDFWLTTFFVMEKVAYSWYIDFFEIDFLKILGQE